MRSRAVEEALRRHPRSTPPPSPQSEGLHVPKHSPPNRPPQPCPTPASAPDSTLENRYYYLQNWRADVVAMIQADGVPLEYVRYSAYGLPYVYSAADVNRDGVVDMDDVYAWDDYHDLTTGDAAVDIDINRDGSVTGDDATLVWDIQAWGAWGSNGRGFLSRLGSRKGYAGYELDPATSQWHVRHRVLVSEMGRWSRRDPAGYVDGADLFEYVVSGPLMLRDPLGLVVDPLAQWCAQCIKSLVMRGAVRVPAPPYRRLDVIQCQLDIRNGCEDCEWSSVAIALCGGPITIGPVTPPPPPPPPPWYRRLLPWTWF